MLKSTKHHQKSQLSTQSTSVHLKPRQQRREISSTSSQPIKNVSKSISKSIKSNKLRSNLSNESLPITTIKRTTSSSSSSSTTTSTTESTTESTSINEEYPPLPFESPTPLPQDIINQVLQQSTIQEQYPNYYFSNFPQLQPTITDMIPKDVYNAYCSFLGNIPRVVSNPDRTNDKMIFDTLVQTVQQYNPDSISNSIGLGSDRHDGKSINHNKNLENNDLVTNNDNEHGNDVNIDNKQHYNWGLIATKDIKAGEKLLQIPERATITLYSYIDPPSNCEEIIQEYDLTITKEELLHNIKMVNTLIDKAISSCDVHEGSYALSIVIGIHTLCHRFSQHYDYIASLPFYDNVAFLDQEETNYSRFTQKEPKLYQFGNYLEQFSASLPKIMNLQCPLQQQLLESIQGCDDVFSAIIKLMQPLSPVPITDEQLGHSFIWPFKLIPSRTFTLGLSNTDTIFTNPEVQRFRIGTENIQFKKVSQLIPVFDLLEHSGDPNCNWGRNCIDLGLSDEDDDANEMKLIACRDIQAGETLTISYNSDKDAQLDLPSLTKENEATIVKKIMSATNSYDLFHTSLYRLPHAMDFLQNKKSYSTLYEPQYGFYSSFHCGECVDFIIDKNWEQIQDHVSKWTPSLDYIATSFQTVRCNDENNTNVNNNNDDNNNTITRSKLSYDDAPLKYIFPDLRNLQTYSIPSSSSSTSPSSLQSLQDDFQSQLQRFPRIRFTWFGADYHGSDFDISIFGFNEHRQIIKKANNHIESIVGFEAPPPSIAKLEIIQSLSEQERITNKIDLNDQSSIDAYIITPQQSREYLLNKIYKQFYSNAATTSSHKYHTPDVDVQPEICFTFEFLITEALKESRRSLWTVGYDNNVVKLHKQPTIQSSILNLYYATILNPYIREHNSVRHPRYVDAMTNLHFYHQNTLISHSNQILATRLGIDHLL